MRNVYFLIPEAEVTQRMINRSNSMGIWAMPRLLKKGLLLDTPYRILEAEFETFPEELLDYRPYTADELIAEIEGPDWK